MAPSAPPRPRRLLLVGMMGSGKTTVAELAARRLGWPHLDSDAEVEQATGRSVPELFAAGGEPAFRVEETAALERALAVEPAVVSVAGGAVLDPHNRERLAGAGTVVWLRATVDTLVARVGDGRGRPLLDDGPRRALTELERVRHDLYAEVADAVVDVDDKTPEEVADAALAAIGER